MHLRASKLENVFSIRAVKKFRRARALILVKFLRSNEMPFGCFDNEFKIFCYIFKCNFYFHFISGI